jgi:hypothetical protein
MKFSKISFSLMSLLFIMSFASCKRDGHVSDNENLSQGSYLKIDGAVNTVLDFGNINTTSASIVVSEYGKSIDSIRLYVTAGENAKAKANWKYIKTVAYGGATTLNVKATEIATALGTTTSTFVPGSFFTIYNEIVCKDKSIFNVENTKGFAGGGAYKMIMTWNPVIACAYNSTGMAGLWEIVSDDDWQDFSAGETVNATVTSPTVLSIDIYPAPAYASPGQSIIPTKITIDPTSGAASVADQAITSYGASMIAARVQTNAASKSWVFSCAKTMSLSLNVKYGATVYEKQVIKLKKL